MNCFLQDPVHDSPTAPHRPSPPPTDHVPTDSDTGLLVELIDDHPLGEDYSPVACTHFTLAGCLLFGM